MVQEVSLRGDVKLSVLVHDFNFHHLEKFISTRWKRKPFPPDKPKMVRVYLVISACNSIETERFASWLLLKDQRGLHITYSVKDRLSGHSFPSPPPNSSDMSIVEHSSRHSSRANAIRIALSAWQKRCASRCYRLIYADPLKKYVFVKWMVDPSYDSDSVRWNGRYGEYTEVSSDQYERGPLTDVCID